MKRTLFSVILPILFCIAATVGGLEPQALAGQQRATFVVA